MTDALVIRDATEADRDGAVALLAAAHGSEVRDAKSWDWLYRGRLDRYVVAEAAGMLAAQYALLPLRVQHRGEVINASLSLDTATHPDFAGQGLMTNLGLRAYSSAGGDLVLGFPNPSSNWVLYNRLGWQELTPFPLLFKPLPGMLPAMAPAWTHVGGAARALARVPRHNQNARVERFDRFEAWADDIWSATSSALGTTVVRDRDHLNWRFADSPTFYDRFLVRAGADPVAYSVLRTVPWRRGHLSYLMELAALPGARSEASTALVAAIDVARATGAAGVAALSTVRDPMHDLLRAKGFRPPPRRMASGFSFGARVSGELESHLELRHPDGWHITAADFDHI